MNSHIEEQFTSIRFFKNIVLFSGTISVNILQVWLYILGLNLNSD